MVRKITLGIAGLVLSIAAATAAERPTLRSEVVVNDNIVRIGDLIDNAGIVASEPVFRSPPLGQTGTIPAAQVLDAVRSHALVGIDPGGVSEVTVTRASRAVVAGEIETLLTTALAKSYALGNAADISLSFTRSLRTFHLEPTQTGALQIDQLRFDSRTGRFDGFLTVANAPSVQLRLSGIATLTTETVQLLRPLARGEVIKLSDVALRRVPRTDVTPETITNPDQAIGMAARTVINAGRPMRTTELMKPELVERGESVTIIYQSPGLMLAVRGKASDGGAEGDMIDVVNLQSKRVVRGTIIGRGQVAVASMTARIVAAADIPSDLSRAKPGAK
ncbi:MAG TPA: flagellar basal body P-ring formation chaperone FlgA [Pseudolabrys sp.]|jgi:flagella basal body P-ring formation protein FlgA|nr:flagellar basal body P-ring formation chaperone FlgA [Pseudolabrys sp.]